jgi:hypothetical protein
MPSNISYWHARAAPVSSGLTGEATPRIWPYSQDHGRVGRPHKLAIRPNFELQLRADTSDSRQTTAAH